MAINIEQVIQNSIKRYTEDETLKRVTLLNILHLNIDILLLKMHDWFGDDIPDEYKKVINSLTTLTTSFLEEDLKIEDIIIENKVEKVHLATLINDVSTEFNRLFGFGDSKISFEADDNYYLIAPRKELTRALYGILLSSYSFMGNATECSIKVLENPSNVVIEIVFSDLIDSFPGVDRIQKVFFSYKYDENKRIGVGVHSSISKLKELGANVKIKNLQGGNSFKITILFPSINFLKTIDEVRSRQVLEGAIEKKSGNIILMVEDYIVEMVLAERFKDTGYNILRCDATKLKNYKDLKDLKGIIIDFSYIQNNFNNLDDFLKIIPDYKKLLILYSEEDNEKDIVTKKIKGLITLKKPIEVEKIINHFFND